MRNWTPGQVVLLWVAGLFVFFFSDDVIQWLYMEYGYSSAQLREILLGRLIGVGAISVLLLGVTWRWLSVRER